jgi:hypothetical protein
MKMRKPSLVVGLLTATALAAAGLTAVPAAAANPVATPSWGAANLISYTDSDFEGSAGDWVAVSNTALTDDTSAAFLHDDSLKATAAASGSQSLKLGATAGQINVTGGDKYRVSAWFLAPPDSGRTITWAMAFYTSSGTWIAWTSGTPVTLNDSGTWQYASALITAPSNAAYDWGGPRVTEAGVSAGETLNMDEVLVEPYRAATIIGAEDTGDDGTQFTSTNDAIGPLQSDKIFYDAKQALPSAYAGSYCAELPADVTCLISYKIMTTNVVSYVESIPPGRNVIFTYWQEPETASFSYDGLTGGPAFVAEFENQSDLIRSAAETAGNEESIFVAGDARGYQYDPGTTNNDGGAGGSCGFTVPSAYVDFYLDDQYEYPASGNDLPGDTYGGAMWKGWLGCVAPQDKPIGLAEYGLNCTNASGGNPDLATTQEGMAADNSYLEGQPDGLPVVMWEYWYENNNGTCTFTTGGSPDGTQAVEQWQADETQNGGGANGL